MKTEAEIDAQNAAIRYWTKRLRTIVLLGGLLWMASCAVWTITHIPHPFRAEGPTPLTPEQIQKSLQWWIDYKATHPDCTDQCDEEIEAWQRILDEAGK